MYFEFYGFKEAPFNLTPNSRFFFSSQKHLEALSTLIYAINERKGIVVITGDIGSGKTTVCRALLNQLDTEAQTALITNTRLSGKDLLMSILEDFEIDFVPGSKSRLYSQLNNYLIDQYRNNRNVVLIIDEAQNLSTSVLEEIRLISNLETENEKLIQIVFLGQPELKKKLALSELEQLRQRISVYFHLSPLSEEDTYKYIIHRLHIASKSKRQYFTDQAMKLIYKFSKGVPRLINQLCDSAFLTGFISEENVIDGKMIKEVIAESPMTQIGSVDSSKYFDDEKVSNLTLEQELNEDEHNFSLSDKYMAEFVVEKKPVKAKNQEIIDVENSEIHLDELDQELEAILKEHVSEKIDEKIVDSEPEKKENITSDKEENGEKDEPQPSDQHVERKDEAAIDPDEEELFFEINETKANSDQKIAQDYLQTSRERVEEFLESDKKQGPSNKTLIIMLLLYSVFIVVSIIIFYRFI